MGGLHQRNDGPRAISAAQANGGLIPRFMMVDPSELASHAGQMMIGGRPASDKRLRRLA